MRCGGERQPGRWRAIEQVCEAGVPERRKPASTRAESWVGAPSRARRRPRNVRRWCEATAHGSSETYAFADSGCRNAASAVAANQRLTTLARTSAAGQERHWQEPARKPRSGADMGRVSREPPRRLGRHRLQPWHRSGGWGTRTGSGCFPGYRSTTFGGLAARLAAGGVTFCEEKHQHAIPATDDVFRSEVEHDRVGRTRHSPSARKRARERSALEWSMRERETAGSPRRHRGWRAVPLCEPGLVGASIIDRPRRYRCNRTPS